MKRYLLTVASLAITFQGFSQDVEKLIKQADVEKTISTLAADDMQGRGTFSSGIEKAAQYIESQFKAVGLKPLADNKDYRQHFTMTKTMPESVSVVINGDTVASAKNAVVSDSEFNWDNNTDVQFIKIGKVKSMINEYFKLIESGKNIIAVVDTSYSTFFKHLKQNIDNGSVTFKKKEHSAQVFILGNIADVKSFKISYKAKQEDLQLNNIVGVLPGKTRPDEYVIFSGHYDHLGIIKPLAGDSIANGANDDASGTTGVLTLAKYYKKLNNNARSIIFVAFTAEELGEYGSRYFATRLDPGKISAMFNMELIGTVSKFGEDAAFITGFERSDFGKILQKNMQGKAFKFHPDPYPEQDLFYRSDNASLAHLGVPAHTISTDQIDVDKTYHTVKDEVSTLNMKVLTATIRAIALSSGSIVNGIDTPTRVK